MSLSLTRLTVGPLMENCYLLADEAAKTAVLVDPGDEAPRLLDALKTNGLQLDAIWLTHAHFDHIGAVAAIKDVLDVPVYLHPDDEVIYKSGSQAAQLWDIPFRQPTGATQPLEPDQVLTFGDTEVKCLFTPGHAPGHISFYLPSEGYVIAGDALFKGSIGRTDLPLGDHAQLLESIRTHLMTLPDNTVVYPGHGPETTVGAEKRTNPFLT